MIIQVWASRKWKWSLFIVMSQPLFASFSQHTLVGLLETRQIDGQHLNAKNIKNWSDVLYKPCLRTSHFSLGCATEECPFILHMEGQWLRRGLRDCRPLCSASSSATHGMTWSQLQHWTWEWNTVLFWYGLSEIAWHQHGLPWQISHTILSTSSILSS